MIPEHEHCRSIPLSGLTMSYRLCCGALNQSDLSLAMVDPARPLSVHSSSGSNAGGAGAAAAAPLSPAVETPAVENITEICQHQSVGPIEEVDEDAIGEGVFKFDFKSDESVRAKSKPSAVSKRKSDKHKDGNKKSSKFWTKFKRRSSKSTENAIKEAPSIEAGQCVCTGYRRTEDHVMGPGVIFSAKSFMTTRRSATASPLPSSASRMRLSMGAGPGPSALAAQSGDLLQVVPAPPHRHGSSVVDLSRFNADDFPTEDVDEIRIAQRARDIELGIEISPRHIVYPHLLYGGGSPPSNNSPSSSSHSSLTDPLWNLTPSFQAQCVVTTVTYAHVEPAAVVQSSSVMLPGAVSISTPSIVGPTASTSAAAEVNYSEYGAASLLPAAMPPAPPPPPCSSQPYIPQTVHTQIDYIHCLVPDLNQIAGCGFYWGVMDRYEAERLLENRPEGTFLLRDSAQEEFLFSVSFRRYGRSLHARIEQWNHKFSFDSHDPGVYAADSVTSLIEHYKDPSCCMFFEPLLTIPLNRTFPFSLQHLCRSVICSRSTYDGMNYLPLPKAVRDYLKYYHYKQKVRVRRFEMGH